jgi:hypothetical protein
MTRNSIYLVKITQCLERISDVNRPSRTFKEIFNDDPNLGPHFYRFLTRFNRHPPGRALGLALRVAHIIIIWATPIGSKFIMILNFRLQHLFCQRYLRITSSIIE